MKHSRKVFTFTRRLNVYTTVQYYQKYQKNLYLPLMLEPLLAPIVYSIYKLLENIKWGKKL